METSEILSNLCFYDSRNPDFKDMYPAEEYGKGKNKHGFFKEPYPVPRDNCYCDNCFSGRDALALEILRLREAHQ
jgi:hypothetical protein